jgi:hypothetical protein
MADTISYAEDNFEQVHLVGLRLWEESHQPDLYTLVLYNEVARNDQNRPLTANERILFFHSIRQANFALSLGDKGFRKYSLAPDKVAYVYDLPKVLSVVSGGERDESGIVADFVNELLDCVAASHYQLPVRFRTTLFALADHTTFDKDLTLLYEQAPSKRDDAVEAILWCIGAIVASARIVG